MLPFDIAPFVCVWKKRNGERSRRERKQSNWIFWSPTRNSWSVTINAKCCTWHTLGGHVILPTPQLLLPVPLNGSRETTTSQPSWGGGGHNIRRRKICRHALRDFCWRRLRWLYTSIFVVVSYVYIETKMCGNVRSFPPFMAGKQKQTSTAGRVAAAAAAAAFTLPKMPFSSQQHSLMSSCRLPTDDAAAKVKLKLKGRRRRRCCHRNNLIINNIIIAVIIMDAVHTLSPPNHTHTHTYTPPRFALSQTPSPTMCFFFCFHFFFFSFLTASFTFGGFCNFRA